MQNHSDKKNQKVLRYNQKKYGERSSAAES
jgi:hypothetical protein